MVNFSIINGDVNSEKIVHLKQVFENIFRYVVNVNVHILCDFTSPVDIIGKYEYIFFIDIPYERGNYFRTPSKKYLNSIALAIRSFEDETVIGIEGNDLLSKEGKWDYQEALANDEKELYKFIRENIPGIKHFEFYTYYSMHAPNCAQKFTGDHFILNDVRNMYKMVTTAINYLAGEYNGVSCIKWEYSPEKDNDWSEFISKFVNVSGEKTDQGILTKEKINQISTEKISVKMQNIYNAVSNKLGIIYGKAGTGKSLALMRTMFNTVQKHHCRFLTYNNMLVMDIKQTLKGMGKFNLQNASISTLHKFFYDVYLKSPVMILHMDESEIVRLFNTCHKRVLRMVILLQSYLETAQGTTSAKAIHSHYKNEDLKNKAEDGDESATKKESFIPAEDSKEMWYFCKFLDELRDGWNSNNLTSLARQYEDSKRDLFMELYGKSAFISGYRLILEQLLLLYRNKDEFYKQFGDELLNSSLFVRSMKEFKDKYEKLYDEFIEKAKQRFVAEQQMPNDDSFHDFMVKENEIIDSARKHRTKESDAEKIQEISKAFKSILRKVRWSDLVLIDEAQDCPAYEKNPLMELFGSNHLVIASGGSDQLIRTPLESRWDVYGGSMVDCQKITLANVTHRQKGRIVDFINAFSLEFNLDTQLETLQNLQGKGRVIIDTRPEPDLSNILSSLYLSGKDHGCSNYENIMMLLSNQYTKHIVSTTKVVEIDDDDTIEFKDEMNRELNLALPDYIKPLDCTINSKAKLLKEVGQDKTRCLLYDSCRGLEVWNVVCMDFDKFFEEKRTGEAAIVYAEKKLGFLSNEGEKDFFMERYAALWCLMALTRPIDSLYLHLSMLECRFSKRIIETAEKLNFVEVLK